jgi:hypothetical protein
MYSNIVIACQKAGQVKIGKTDLYFCKLFMKFKTKNCCKLQQNLSRELKNNTVKLQSCQNSLLTCAYRPITSQFKYSCALTVAPDEESSVYRDALRRIFFLNCEFRVRSTK